jgi:hypothetical protein
MVGSSTESEYVALTEAAKEALCLFSIPAQLFTPLNTSTTPFGDNQSTITHAKDHKYHAHTNHIDICFWIIEQGSLRLVYYPTANNTVANTPAKPLQSAKVKDFTSTLRLHSA